MTNINEHPPADDEGRGGAEAVRQGRIGGGNVVAFRPKPAPPPNTQPPPPPTAA